MKIYTSDINSILIDKITTEVADLATKNKTENYVMIVPEKFSVSMEKLVLEKSKSHTFLNVQVVTLSRLLYKLLPSTNNYLSKVMGIMATKRVLGENYDNLVCYKKTAKTIGFAENIYNTISELKNSKVTPADYYKKNKTGTSLDIKLHDIFLLYKAYDEFIAHEKLVDACDRFDLLAEKIRESEYIKNSHIYVVGYDNTTRSGLMVFEALYKQAKSLTCACVDNSMKGNSYICPPEMLYNYIEIGKRNGENPIVVKIMNSKISISSHIANNLFSYPYSRMRIDGQISLYETNSVVEEVSLVAEHIRRLVIEKKYRYRDFAVVCPDLEGYKSIIKMVFDDYMLPAFIDATQSLKDHPLSRFVQSALNVARKNFNADEVLEFANNIFSGISVEDYAVFENYVIKFAINYDDFKKPFKYKTQDPIEIERAELVRKVLITKLCEFNEVLKNANVVEEYNKAVVTLFEIFEITTKTEEFEEKLGALKKFELRDATKQVLEKIQELLLGTEKILKSHQISVDEYYSCLSVGLLSETISLIPVSVDSVFIGDISTSKFLGIKNLIVIGATDGAVPRVKDDCGIIVDKELELMSSTIGKKIEPTIKTINAREKFKLITILEEFEDTLLVVYSKVGRTGDAQRPSSIFRELSRIFYCGENKAPLEIISRERKEKLNELLNADKKLENFAYGCSSMNIANKKLLKHIQDKKEGKENKSSDNLYGSLLEVLEENASGDIKEIIKFALKNKVEEELKDATKLFFKDHKTSVSQLECYFSCPFKFFANFGLRLKPRDEAFLKSVDYGNVLHKIAEIYMRNIKKFIIDDGRPFQDKFPEFEKLINFVFSEEKLKTANNKYMLLQLKKEAFRLIDALTYQYINSAFRPIGEEVVFGSKGKTKGVKLGDKISIDGKVDRVDVFGEYFRVIDYKTGHIDLSPKTTYYGQKVQLFAYLMALKNDKLKSAGTFYLPIRNVFIDEDEGENYSTYKLQGYYNSTPEVLKALDTRISPENSKSDIVNMAVSSSKENKETNTLVASGNYAFTEDELNSISNYVKSLCELAVDEILAGYTKATPLEIDGRTPCEYCEYRNACGRDFNSNNEVRKTMSNIKFNNF